MESFSVGEGEPQPCAASGACNPVSRILNCWGDTAGIQSPLEGQLSEAALGASCAVCPMLVRAVVAFKSSEGGRQILAKAVVRRRGGGKQVVNGAATHYGGKRGCFEVG